MTEHIDRVLDALGRELQAKRIEMGLTRAMAIELIAKRTGLEIGDKALLTYEAASGKGYSRGLTIRRLLELCQAYGMSPVRTLATAIKRANPSCCPSCGRE